MRLSLLILLIPFLTFAQQKVLHYDETTGFNHGTRNASLAFFESLKSALNITVTKDSDGSEFTQAKLMDYDVVIFSNTSGDEGLIQSQRDALEWFIDTKGGGLIGIHAASDTYRHSSANGNKTGTWDWYAETMGGSVQENPNHTGNQHNGIISETMAVPATENINFPWQKREEYYYWENGYLNTNREDILWVDDTGGSSWDDPRPVAWQRTNAAGSRIFYTSLGHFAENFSGPGFPQFRQLMRDATSWALLANSTVPVVLSSFTVRPFSKHIQVSWRTFTETNSDYFEIQRSTDNKTWNTIEIINAAGHSTSRTDYSYEDQQPLHGSSYYRLKQVDYDSEYTFSETRSVSFVRNIGLKITPNPASNYIYVNVANSPENITIYDSSGRLRIKSQSQLDIDISALENGLYYIKVKGKNDQVHKLLVHRD